MGARQLLAPAELYLITFSHSLMNGEDENHAINTTQSKLKVKQHSHFQTINSVHVETVPQNQFHFNLQDQKRV